MKFAAFVDVANLYYTIKYGKDGRHLDYAQFAEYINEFGEGVIRAYGTQLNDEAQSFIAMLTKVGIVPHYKRPVYVGNGKHKSSWAVGITIDAIRAAEDVELIILATGSGDYTPLVQYLQGMGKKVIVIGFNLSKDLRTMCDNALVIPESMLV